MILYLQHTPLTEYASLIDPLFIVCPFDLPTMMVLSTPCWGVVVPVGGGSVRGGSDNACPLIGVGLGSVEGATIIGRTLEAAVKSRKVDFIITWGR